jgi:hypothetical protein
MFKHKLIASLLLAILVIAAQTGIVAAAPAPQGTTPITGTIKSITIVKGTTATEPPTILVTILDSLGKTQKAYVSVETAVALGLVTIDPVTKLPVVDKTKIGQTITIEPTQILPPPTQSTTGEQPVAKLLATYFDVDYDVIMELHTQGFGFGEIAQALFIAQKLGDVMLAGDILNAKKTGDYSAFTLTDGSAPTNWGQFRNAVLGHGKNNLGGVVSGNANSSTDNGSAPGNSGNTGSNGNGHGHDPDKEHGNGKGHVNGKPKTAW